LAYLGELTREASILVCNLEEKSMNGKITKRGLSKLNWEFEE